MKKLGKTISRAIERAGKRCVMTRKEYRFWKENHRIAAHQPTKARAQVVIAAMGPDGFRTRGKVNHRLFFPPFCRILGEYGIRSVYVNSMASLEQELRLSEGMPTITIDLVNEDYGDLDTYDIPGGLSNQPSAVFNSRRVARIIGDKRQANAFLSSSGVPMPRIADAKTVSGKIFSNARGGSKERVSIYDDINKIDEDRYNTEFVDTRIEYNEHVYYTTVRLMCIGTRLVQAYVRARPEAENDPSVHNADTPRNRELLDHLYGALVSQRIEEYAQLAEKIGSALDPGFYAHDILVANDSDKLFLCETGFKFFDISYWNVVESIVDDRAFQYNVVDQETHARHAASVFIAYCTEAGFL